MKHHKPSFFMDAIPVGLPSVTVNLVEKLCSTVIVLQDDVYAVCILIAAWMAKINSFS